MKEQDWRQPILYDSTMGGARDIFGRENSLPHASMISRGLRMSFP